MSNEALAQQLDDVLAELRVKVDGKPLHTALR
jgi:hypothetical protein